MASHSLPLPINAVADETQRLLNSTNRVRRSLQLAVTPNLLWRTGAILTTSGIVTGAFGAHAIKQRVTPEQLGHWSTASQYAIVNGVALLALSLHPRFGVHKFAGPAIAAGAAIFSGTIFALVLNREKFRFLGPITPLGGTLLIAGWVSLAF